MYSSTHLGLPFVAPAQAQKHVTVNETFALLDAVTQGAVLDMGRNTPPATPAEGDRHLIGSSPTGVWALHAGRFAAYDNNRWIYSSPSAGWRLYNLADGKLYVLNVSGDWVVLSAGGPSQQIDGAERIGLGMAADAANPFSAKINSALWTARTIAEGGSGNLYMSVNKSEATRDAGLAFQTSFITRAIAGLFGSNRFRVAVSPDGSTFRDALAIDDATGIVDQPRLPRFKAHTNYDNFAAADTWVKIGINTVEANDQGAFNAATNRFTAPVAGTYAFGASLVYKIQSSTSARMRGRLVRNGTAEIPGTFGEISGAHVSGATALWFQTLAALAPGDTVELQGSYRSGDALFAATHTTFWGFKVG